MSFTAANCVLGPNHAIAIHGWTIGDDGREVLLARNSWGVSWGEGGYFRAYYQPEVYNSCFLTSQFWMPTY